MVLLELQTVAAAVVVRDTLVHRVPEGQAAQVL
jgi:hypothetical protein